MADSKCFAFVFGMASGHINPSLPLARRLVSQGHEVHYLAREQMRRPIEDTGASYWSEMEEERELYDGCQGDLVGATQSLKQERGLLETDSMMVSYLKVGAWSLTMQLPGCIRWMQKIKPSVVVYCPLLNQDAGYAAHVLQIPAVPLLTTAGPGSVAAMMRHLCAGQDPEAVIREVEAYEPLKADLRSLKESYNLDYDPCSAMRHLGFQPVLKMAKLVMMTTTQELQDPAPHELVERYQEAGVTFVGIGPLLDVRGAVRAAGHRFEEQGQASQDGDLLKAVKQAKEAGRKVIYCSMGTVITGDSEDFGWQAKPHGLGVTGKQLCQAAFAAVLETFGTMEPKPLVVVATGPQEDALEGLSVPENAICLPEVPQVDLLRCGVDLVLTHFGQNSFMESLSLGIPMVGCPGCVDQPANALKAQALGVALQVERPQPALGEEAEALELYQKKVSAALLRVFHEPSFHQRAQEISRGIQAAGGVEKAVEILMQLATPPLPKLLGQASAMEEQVEQVVKVG